MIASVSEPVAEGANCPKLTFFVNIFFHEIRKESRGKRVSFNYAAS